MFEALLQRYTNAVTETVKVPIPAGTYYLGGWYDWRGFTREAPTPLAFFGSGGDQGWCWCPTNNPEQSNSWECISGVGLYPFDPDQDWDESKQYDLEGITLVVPEDTVATAVKDKDDGCGWHSFNIPNMGNAGLWGCTDLEQVVNHFEWSEDWSFVETKEEIDFIIDSNPSDLEADELEEWREEIYTLKGIKQ